VGIGIGVSVGVSINLSKDYTQIAESKLNCANL
jgi:hypothetical protein